MERRNITLKDVARAAKISVSTASKAINNIDGVSEHTRQRVLNAAKKLNYRASFVPKSLRNKTSRSIGLIIPNILNPFFCTLVNGVEDAALKEGYVVILGSAKEDTRRESSYLDVFSERWIDGIILAAGASEEDEEYIGYIKKRGIPIVFIDREIEEHFTNSIGIDNDMAMYTATKYLIELGHEDIGFISGPLGVKVFNKRLEGYKRALENSGLEFQEDLVQEGDETAVGGGVATKKLLKTDKKITAILASNDMMAIGSLKELSKAGLRVPEDISVMGFDNIPLASVTTPALTTVSQPSYEMGVEAVKLLLEITKGKKTAKSKIILGTEIVTRESTAHIRKTRENSLYKIKHEGK